MISIYLSFLRSWFYLNLHTLNQWFSARGCGLAAGVLQVKAAKKLLNIQQCPGWELHLHQFVSKGNLTLSSMQHQYHLPYTESNHQNQHNEKKTMWQNEFPLDAVALSLQPPPVRCFSFLKDENTSRCLLLKSGPLKKKNQICEKFKCTYINLQIPVVKVKKKKCALTEVEIVKENEKRKWVSRYMSQCDLVPVHELLRFYHTHNT